MHDDGPIWLPDDLESRFLRAFGREMLPEERRYFGLVEVILPYRPELKKPATQATEEGERSQFPEAA